MYLLGLDFAGIKDTAPLTHRFGSGANHLAGVITPTWVYYNVFQASMGVLPTLAGLIECAGLADTVANTIGITVCSMMYAEDP